MNTAPIVQTPANGPPPDAAAIDVYSNDEKFSLAQRMAKALAASTLVPKAYQQSIPNCLIAIEVAHRIGASVFMTMQNLDIIHGKPGWRSTFLIATVNASSSFTPLRFRFEGKPGTDGWGCRAVAKDKQTGEELVGSLITIGLAKAEGWFQREGSKWKTMPEQMLCYRSAAFWTRIYAPEKSLGMQTSEELADLGGGGNEPAAMTLPAAIVPGNTKALEEALTAAPAQAEPVASTPVEKQEAGPMTDAEKAAAVEAERTEAKS